MRPFVVPMEVETDFKKRQGLCAGLYPTSYRIVGTMLLFRNNFNLIYLFMSRHEVHSMNTHTAERRLIKTDNTERSTRH